MGSGHETSNFTARRQPWTYRWGITVARTPRRRYGVGHEPPVLLSPARRQRCVSPAPLAAMFRPRASRSERLSDRVTIWRRGRLHRGRLISWMAYVLGVETWAYTPSLAFSRVDLGWARGRWGANGLPWRVCLHGAGWPTFNSRADRCCRSTRGGRAL
jgi:hypothetical protein